MAIWSIETQFLEGTISGPRILASSLCTMYVSPREKVFDVVKDIPHRYVLYFLLGDTELGSPKAYIGQTKDFQQRVRSHLAGKAFWEKALVFISNADRITSSEALYLEYLGIQKAIETGTYNMEENAQVPPMPPISYGKKIEMNQFFEEIQFFLCFYGCDIFEKKGRKKRIVKASPTPPAKQGPPIPPAQPISEKFFREYHFTMKKVGVSAKLHYYPAQKKYIVLSGSTISAKNASSLQPSITSFRDSVFASPTKVMKQGNIYQLLEDIEVPGGSASAAAKFCAGNSRNGKIDWIDADGHTIGEFLDGMIS